MSGFVQAGGGGRRPTQGVVSQPEREIVEVDSPSQSRTVSSEPRREVVEVSDGDGSVVHLVEPVLVDPALLGVGVADLVDVDVSNAPLNTPLVWRVDANGVWTTSPIDEARWGEEIRLGDAVPDPTAAPLGAVFVNWNDGTIYRAEET